MGRGDLARSERERRRLTAKLGELADIEPVADELIEVPVPHVPDYRIDAAFGDRTVIRPYVGVSERERSDAEEIDLARR